MCQYLGHDKRLSPRPAYMLCAVRFLTNNYKILQRRGCHWVISCPYTRRAGALAWSPSLTFYQIKAGSGLHKRTRATAFPYKGAKEDLVSRARV